MGEHKIWGTSKNELEKYRVYMERVKSIVTYCEGKIDIKKLNEFVKELISIYKNDTKTLSCITEMNELSNNDYMHSIKVALISLLIGRWNNYEEDKLTKLVLAGLLHDVGKDSKEYVDGKGSDSKIMSNLIYKRHPILGYEKLTKFVQLDMDVLKAVLTHHEKCDGTGFPLGLRGERISDIAKVVGIADTYDRLRETMHVFDVIKEFRSNQMGSFELDLVTNFCTNIINHYVGNHVLLSTGEVARIKEIQPHALYRPIVAVDDKNIDLYVESKIIIEEVY